MKIYALVSVWKFIIEDVAVFLSFEEAERKWQEWTRFNGKYGDHMTEGNEFVENFNQDYDESKIFEIELPKVKKV